MATTQAKIEFIMQAMNNAKGDDLERAEMALKHSPTPNKPYGQSGRTLIQIVEEYRKHRKLWEESMEYLKQHL